ncbi:methionine-tRNA ligase [Schizosaccharomyces cryophilus OY26]|uniref:Probable methionine--tRNA ligase, mitochondrial n=1 Tax=Schizosaccharomyces cryophilus (strain OY26 / ATCC MYA-4695 / CBS 11777 / NBRC 106824 / NRRL Y48691) TaxID=653667 RepID=S9VUL1_SCHCR|nr:methionine-tRNA ligase [Schizosaccharomyces cryophilus OY26]EPY51478.1 methionine-tRNA ligase [Schizosaccharomyces cryophilus OY26]
MFLKGPFKVTVPNLQSLTKPFFITTPIFYVNAAPHLGHLYSLVLCDSIARFQKLYRTDRPVFSSTGTDEHGLKVQTVAQELNKHPLDLCNTNSQRFRDLAVLANTPYSHFIRTTDHQHATAVKNFWNQLKEKNYIEFQHHEGWYSTSDETFYPESALQWIVDEATGKKTLVSVETGKQVQWSSEMNYHFKLTSLQSRLIELYEQEPSFVQPSIYHSQILTELKSGLQDLSISRPRSRLSWGIPVPKDDSQTIYVWLDALVNYLTVTGYPWISSDHVNGGWPADVHIIGKDIIRFHCIYWPAFLMAAGLPLPKQILVHSHWTMNKMKMSKSLGNVVNPFTLIQNYGEEIVKYYLLKQGRLTSDSNFDIQGLEKDYEHDLRRNFGVLTSRIQSKKLYVTEETQKEWPSLFQREKYQEFVNHLSQLPDACAACVHQGQVFNLIENIQNTLRSITKLLQESEPWNLDSNSSTRTDILMLTAHTLRICAILFQSIMPKKSEELLDQLGVAKESRSFHDAKDTFIATQFNLGKKQKNHLFQKRH